MDNSDMLKNQLTYEVETTSVSYYQDITGYFARPSDGKPYPGVVMIHEWWGLNNNIKDMARQLAGEGYLVLAVDLYNGEVASTSDRARELVGALNQEAATGNLKAALAFLRGQGASKVASLGWCFGGGQSMRLAVSGEDLDATVIYYGNLETNPAKLVGIRWPVLGVFGQEDTSIPVNTVLAFRQELRALGIQNEIYIYPDVGHAFANPSGANYAPEETKDAWAKTLDFLDTHLN